MFLVGIRITSKGGSIQAQALLGKGDLKQGTEILERADKSFPNNPLIKYQLALAYVQGRNTSQAMNELEQAITIAPKYVEAIVLLAQLRLRAGDPQICHRAAGISIAA